MQRERNTLLQKVWSLEAVVVSLFVVGMNAIPKFGTRFPRACKLVEELASVVVPQADEPYVRQHDWHIAFAFLPRPWIQERHLFHQWRLQLDVEVEFSILDLDVVLVFTPCA